MSIIVTESRVTELPILWLTLYVVERVTTVDAVEANVSPIAVAANQAIATAIAQAFPTQTEEN